MCPVVHPSVYPIGRTVNFEFLLQLTPFCDSFFLFFGSAGRARFHEMLTLVSVVILISYSGIQRKAMCQREVLQLPQHYICHFLHV